MQQLKSKLASSIPPSSILLQIPQSHLTIYFDRLSINSPVTKSLTNIPTSPSLGSIPCYQYSFSLTNVVFSIYPNPPTFLLLSLPSLKPLIQVSIPSQKLHLLSSLLKKKWCQYGFQQQFQTKQQIGKGAMANVFRVERKIDRKVFAAKVVSLQVEDQKAYDTFINQTRILRILASPHIVALEGVYVTAKKQLISVLQYLDGGTLFHQLKNNLIPGRLDKLQAINQLCLALCHLHSKRLLHRDIKLQNILIRLTPTKQYVLTDFGLSNWMGETNILYQKCGTPGYLAPQMLMQQKGVCLLSHKMDVFSFGIVCYFIFMGECLFQYGGCPKKLLLLNRRAEFSLSQAKVRLNREEFRLLEDTLSVDPQKRPSIKQILSYYIPKIRRSYQKTSQKQNLKQKSLTRTQQSLLIHPKTASFTKSSLKIITKPVPSSTLQQKKKSLKQLTKLSLNKMIRKVGNSLNLRKDNGQKEKYRVKDKSLRKDQMRGFVDD